MELHEALAQIAEIRHQLAGSELFRGYRSPPVALSGVLALGAAALQAAVVPEPARQLGAYLAIWIGAAALGAAAAGWGMIARRRRPAAWAGAANRLALEQFAPCLIAGGLITAVIVRAVPEAVGLLPGLWQVIFSLGIFASCRLLPRPIWGVAAFYLASGLYWLGQAGTGSALSPWAMGLPFGAGQVAASAILYWTLERGDAPD